MPGRILRVASQHIMNNTNDINVDVTWILNRIHVWRSNLTFFNMTYTCSVNESLTVTYDLTTIKDFVLVSGAVSCFFTIKIDRIRTANKNRLPP